MQILVWMWCIIFSLWIGSIWVFGFTAVLHLLLIFGIVMTVGVFEAAKRKPSFFLRNGYHTPSRSRSIWIDGKKVKLDDDDTGGDGDGDDDSDGEGDRGDDGADEDDDDGLG